MRQAYLISALATLVLVTLQFFLAGLGMFGATSFEAHEFTGFALVHGATLLMLIFALAGRMGRPHWIYGLGLFLLVFVQVGLPGAAEDAPGIAAIHPLLALVIWVGAAQAVQAARAATRSTADRSTSAVAP